MSKKRIRIVDGCVNFIGMITRWEDCDHALLGDEVEHLYKGKSYCGDCYKDLIALLSRFSKYHDNKSFRDLTRADIVAFLDNFLSIERELK